MKIGKVILHGAVFLFFALIPALGQTPRTLPPRETVEREIKGGETHLYAVRVAAGQFLDVRIAQQGVNIILTVLDGDGDKKIELNDDDSPDGEEHLAMIVERSGDYRLEARTTKPDAPAGRYVIKIAELRVADEKDQNKADADHLMRAALMLRRQATGESLRAAASKYEEAALLYRRNADAEDEGEALNSAGVVYNILGEWQKAIDNFTRVMLLNRDDKKSQSVIAHNIGTIRLRLGEPLKALEAFQQSLALGRESGNKGLVPNTLVFIGMVDDQLGERGKALDVLGQALTLARENKDQAAEAFALSYTGATYYNLGEFDQALEFYHQALELMRALGDGRNEAVALGGIALALEDSGRRREALEYHERGLQLVRERGDKPSEGTALNNLGRAYHFLGEPLKAIEYFQQALTLARSMGSKIDEARTLSNLGRTQADTGDKRAAQDSIYQSLPLSRAAKVKRGDAVAFTNLSEVLSADNERFAVFHGKMAANSYQILRSNVVTLSRSVQQTFLKSIEPVYRRLAAALLKQRRYAEAQQVLNAFKDQQYFDLNQSQSLAPLAMTEREQEFAAAFDRQIERVGKLDLQATDLRRRSAPAEELRTAEAELAKARDDYEVLIRSAETAFSQPLDDRDTLAATLELTSLQNVLRELSRDTKQRTVAVYTLVGEDDYYALIITDDSVSAVTTPIKGQLLGERAKQFWRLLKSPKYDPQPLAKELYDMIFAPVANRLPTNVQTILWNLDGNLRYIPVAALHDGKRYLVERYNNIIFTRADAERLTRPVASNARGIGFGSSEAHTVKLNNQELHAAALPAVRLELDRIFKVSNRDSGVLLGAVLLDSSFDRRAFAEKLKGKIPLVHIASHFRFVAGDEASSFLLLGDGTPFTLNEMKNQPNMFAGVDLLALSACETAAQRAAGNGREVDGFAELAQRLGAGAVIASLWEVADNSTAELMTRFYQNYQRPNTNKASALRRAQLALMRGGTNSTDAAVSSRLLRQEDPDTVSGIYIEPARLLPFKRTSRAPYAHPFYWSPFVLIGNWR